MKIWVRTQKGNRLISCDDIFIELLWDDPTEPGHVKARYDQYYAVQLGVYRNESRALEVLDDIQKHIEKILRDADNRHDISYVYEMPEE